VADFSPSSTSSIIRKITPAGVVTTLAGTFASEDSRDGVGRAARFNYLSGLAVDPAGNLFACDWFNGSLRKITPDGTVTTLRAGNGTPFHFTQTVDIAVDAMDNLYLVWEGAPPFKLSAAGVMTTLVDANTNQTVPGRFLGVDVDANGVIYYITNHGGASDPSEGVYRGDPTGFNAPTITTQPGSRIVAYSSSVTFSVTVSGDAPLAYRWRKNGVNLTDGFGVSGTATATLSNSAVLMSDAGSYDVVVTNALGSITSAAATLTVNMIPPSISTQPVGQSRTAGTTVGLSVAAWSPETNFFQWRKDGLNLVNGGRISGATTTALTITGVQAGDAGSYDVVVSNSGGSVTSDVATLVVSRLGQTINFGTLTDRAFTAAPFTLSATATSGLPVTFSIFSGPANVTGNSLTLTGAGLVIVRASQAGDPTYAAAPDVDRSFTVAGGFGSWQQSKFTAGELADANISGPNAVYGQDGLPNLIKYALGLEPSENITTGLPAVSTTATDWVYSYTRPSNLADVTYEVEYSANLTTWSSLGAGTLGGSSGGMDTYTVTYPLGSAANVYFRLKVTAP
jgi:hypothetical protein